MNMRLASIVLLALALAFGAWLLTGSSASAEDAPHPPAADAHGDGAHAEPEINPLAFKTDLAIWTAVVFLLLLTLLTTFAWKPIMQGLDERERRVADNISEAERNNSDAKKMLEQYQQQLADAEEEVRQMLGEAKEEAQKAHNAILRQAKAEAETEKQRAMRDIEAASTLAMEELAATSANLAVDLAQKIVNKSIDRTAHSHLIQEAVSNLGKNNNN